MLICIAGKNDIAVNVLEYLLKYYKENEIACILNKTETGKNSWQKSLEWYCKKNKIKILSLNDIYSIKDMVFLSLEFDQIVKPEMFLSKKLYNIHFSLLPKYKGMYTSIWPVYNGETETGVTLHFIDKGIDTGDIIDQEKFSINENDTSYDVYKKYIEVGTSLIIRNVNDIIEDNVRVWKKQSISLSTYYSKNSINFDNIVLDCNKTAWQIKRQVKAFCFRPYQLIKFKNNCIINVEILKEKSSVKAGAVIEEGKSYFKVATIDYNVILYKDEFENLLSCIQEFDNEEVKRILKVKNYINERNKRGWSALMVATYNNNKEIFYLLLKYGANIYEKNWNGTNLLMYAKDCYVKTLDSELFEYLYDLGLSIYEKDFNGKSLVDYCYEETIKNIGRINIFNLRR
ncbi:formyltransferase family protein [uncultured Brachyspira sp.]|uniref:formyltransferase family protein n=1 Tax=uncultured Brachyspira sp. TaxID=221953 RepID=UPI002619B8BE|nr:formyltransferase family protein [uncultured Brachyspira sp.]